MAPSDAAPTPLGVGALALPPEDAATADAPRSFAELRVRLRRVSREAAKFLAVGAVGYLTDVGLYNVLVHIPPGDGVLHDKPLTAKVLSLFAATLVTFVGNRQWAFRQRRAGNIPRQYAVFLALNIVAAAITLTPLAISRYLLGYTSPLADNIAASIIGVGLALIFRFLTYRRWVFNTPRPVDMPGRSPVAALRRDH